MISMYARRSWLLLIFVMSIGSFGALAQTGPQEFILPSNTAIREVAWKDSVYLFKSFISGRIIFDTGYGSTLIRQMNYNIYLERMEEISRSGDTVALDKIKSSHVVELGRYKFRYFPRKGYMRIIEQGKVSLGAWDYFDAGYLIALSSGYQSESMRVMMGTDSRRQTFERDRSYIRASTYFLISGNDYYPVKESILYKLYPSNTGVLRRYLSDNPVDYSDMVAVGLLIRRLNLITGSVEAMVPGAFSVPDGQSVKNVWRDSVYVFPSFMEATARSSTHPGCSRTYQMNYNAESGEMDYINAAGDTIQFEDKYVSMFSFDDHTFLKLPAEGLTLTVLQGSTSLLERRRIKTIQDHRGVEASAGPRIDSPPGNQAMDQLFVVDKAFFFFNQKVAWRADKMGFSRAYPKSRKKIDQYLIDRPVNFRSRNDLIRLVSFCQQF